MSSKRFHATINAFKIYSILYIISQYFITLRFLYDDYDHKCKKYMKFHLFPAILYSECYINLFDDRFTKYVAIFYIHCPNDNYS